MYSEDRADLEYVYGKDDEYINVKIHKEDFINLLNKIKVASKLRDWQLKNLEDACALTAPANILIDATHDFLCHLFQNNVEAITFYMWITNFGERKDIAREIAGKTFSLTCATDLWKILVKEREE